MKINNDYKWFVVHTEDYTIYSGWEYKEDALESLNDLSEIGETMYSVFSASYIQSRSIGIDPYDFKNWSGYEDKVEQDIQEHYGTNDGSDPEKDTEEHLNNINKKGDSK